MLALDDPNVAGVFRPRTTIAADGTVEGYASLFGEVDQARDMVMPGAFRDTLALRGLRRIPMLFQHDPSEPIGIWLELTEDHRGLRARGKLIPDVQRAREILALVKAGAIDGLSIGFKTARARVDPRSRVRKIDAVDLWEISIVTFPLLAGARVHAVKNVRVAAPAEPDRHERLFRRHPRLSFARTRAEQAWQSLARPAAQLQMPGTKRAEAPAVSRVSDVARAAGAGSATAELSSGGRLAAVRARRLSPPRRDRIRGWIADSGLRSTADLRRAFAQSVR
jgi:HK97 family phage prohead protease